MCEGRLFCSFSSFMLPAIYQVQMERECLSVSMSLLGLSSAPSLLKKLMKISILVLWKLNVRPIIFLDNTSIMASTKKQFIQESGHFNILQTLDFWINKNRSVLHLCQILQFLGVEINSKEMRVSLPQEKKYKIISQCQNILKEKSVYVREMGQMLWRLSSTAIVVLVALLQYQKIQRQKIAELVNTKKSRFDDSFDRGSEKRDATVDEDPTTKQRENLDKFTAPNKNINRYFFLRLWGLSPRPKHRPTLEISGEERSYKYFEIEGSKVWNFNFSLFPSQGWINTHSNR